MTLAGREEAVRVTVRVREEPGLAGRIRWLAALDFEPVMKSIAPGTQAALEVATH